MSAIAIRVLSIGTALPGRPVDTATLARHMGLSADRGRHLEDVLRIRTRHLTRDLHGGVPVTLTELATTAAERALDAAGLTGSDIGGIVMSTATPDSLMPATVNLVADRLGVDQVPSYQLMAGATGALQAADLAVQMMSTGRQDVVLVIAGDVSTKQFGLSPDDGANNLQQELDAATFGDGAAAAILTSLDRPGSYVLRRLQLRRGVADHPPGRTAGWFGAAGRGTRKPLVTYDRELVADIAPKLAVTLTSELLDDLGWSSDTLARLLPPQLPGAVAGTTAEQLAIPAERCVSLVEEIGHAANSLPLFQLARAYEQTDPEDQVAGVAIDPSDWAAAGFALERI